MFILRSCCSRWYVHIIAQKRFKRVTIFVRISVLVLLKTLYIQLCVQFFVNIVAYLKVLFLLCLYQNLGEYILYLSSHIVKKVTRDVIIQLDYRGMSHTQ